MYNRQQINDYLYYYMLYKLYYGKCFFYFDRLQNTNLSELLKLFREIPTILSSFYSNVMILLFVLSKYYILNI